MWLPSALAEICTGSGPAPVVPVSVALAMSSRETVPLLGWLIQPTPGAETPEPNAPPLSGMCATTCGGVDADERTVTCAVPLSRAHGFRPPKAPRLPARDPSDRLRPGQHAHRLHAHEGGRDPGGHRRHDRRRVRSLPRGAAPSSARA